MICVTRVMCSVDKGGGAPAYLRVRVVSAVEPTETLIVFPAGHDITANHHPPRHDTLCDDHKIRCHEESMWVRAAGQRWRPVRNSRIPEFPITSHPTFVRVEAVAWRQ